MLNKTLTQQLNQNKPIRVGLVGAGFAGRGFALQLLTATPGLELVAVSNRSVEYGRMAFEQLGIDSYTLVHNRRQFTTAFKKQTPILTDDSELVCSSPEIDVVVEATGEIEFGAQVVLSAIKQGKHVVLINAELDTTLGPILKSYADAVGVVYTQADGDQPGKLINLMRQVEYMGFEPVLLGNIKSLIDTKRTPETQANFAREHYQRPKMITSFADGTKISFEMASLANATGFKVGQRGMFGPECKHVDQAQSVFDLESLREQPLVDYILGAEPSFGIFVIGYSDNPIRQRYMDVYKMGKGPFYTFYTPYHLSPLEAPFSVVNAAVNHQATMAPIKPVCDVIATAKRTLKKGERLDGVGGFTCYGVIDNASELLRADYLPMGLSDGCVVTRDVAVDQPISYQDVQLPKGRLADALKAQQTALFEIGDTVKTASKYHQNRPKNSQGKKLTQKPLSLSY